MQMTIQGRRVVFDKTRGHCHFCGDKVVLGHHGKTTGYPQRGAWELDHVIQAAKGGKSNLDNYLPACWKCNRLRWHRKGRELRRLILLGLVVNDEIKKKTKLGSAIEAKLTQHKVATEGRRVKREARRTR
jgi:5-methylcytosine-specific restriction endonuclease McrA